MCSKVCFSSQFETGLPFLFASGLSALNPSMAKFRDLVHAYCPIGATAPRRLVISSKSRLPQKTSRAQKLLTLLRVPLF